MSAATARLFVALDLPPAVRTALAEWAERELAAQPGLRLAAAESLHITLCFLGSREEAQLGALAELVLACASPAPKMQLTVGEPVWRPTRRPRRLAVDLADPDVGV